MITQRENVQNPSDCHPIRSKRIGRLTRWIGLAASFLLMGGWGCDRQSAEDAYLVRVGTSEVTVAEFKAHVEAASEEAFPGEQSVNPDALNDLRVRTLNQLTEEMVIAERAKQTSVKITEDELNQAVNSIKADYPDDTFEKTLLENAVSFTAWKQKMATRMLVDKVIARELVDKVEITSEDVAAYFQAHYPDGVAEGEDENQINRKIVRHLRQQKAEKMYQNWIERLRVAYPVDINQQQWNDLIAAD